MAKRTVKSKDKAGLLLAFDHAYLVSGGPAAYAPYALFQPGWLLGYDGIVAAGARITEDLQGAPHTETFRQALMRAGSPYSVTSLANGRFVVTGDSVRVEVPSCEPAMIPNIVPDHPLCEVGPQFSNAMLSVYKITASREQSVIGASVYVKRESAVATNGNTIVEAFHGAGLPNAVLLPREFVDTLSKVKYTATHVGWSDTTFTMWFGPNAFLRCNVYNEAYPDTDVFFAQMMSQCSEYRNVPTQLLQAVETLKPFAEGQLYFMPYGLDTKTDNTGARFVFEHYMPLEAIQRAIPYDAMRYMASYGSAVAFCKDGLYWYGDVLRGITKA